MNAIVFIQTLKQQGINLVLLKGSIRLDSPKSRVSQDVRKLVLANKTVIIEALILLKAMESDWNTLQSMEPYICGSSESYGTPAYEQTFQRFIKNLKRYEHEATLTEPDYLSLKERA